MGTSRDKKRGGKSNKGSRTRGSSKELVILEYYTRPFRLLFLDYIKTVGKNTRPHRIRKDFWQLVPPGIYSTIEAHSIIEKYLKILEDEIRSIVSKSSLAYWLHHYRRQLPAPVGANTDPVTVLTTRAILEAAVQKYAMLQLCTRMGITGQVPIERVLGGLLMDPRFESERELLQTSPKQLVITDFSQAEIREIVDLEKLAFEVWRSSATMRSTSKGADLVVFESEECYGDARTDELDAAIKIFDERNHMPLSSAIGVYYGGIDTLKEDWVPVFIPEYNVAAKNTDNLNKTWGRVFGIEFPKGFKPNFLWHPFNIRNYRETHIPLAEGFFEKNKVTLDSVLLVVAALCSRVFYLWLNAAPAAMYIYWQRAYDGPIQSSKISEIVMKFLPRAADIIGIEHDRINEPDIEAGIKFWTLSKAFQSRINLSYPGPHSIFLPVDNDYFFIDYSWMSQRLFDLFYDVKIKDQRFKGKLLESAIKNKPSALPDRNCKALNGQERNIDYACAVGKHLVIAECKVVARSIGYVRGYSDSLDFRNREVVDRSIEEADEKAHWLVRNPKGKNYDVSQYDYILPVGISPFVEFIPSLNTRYWITDQIPRVLTPMEFYGLLDTRDSIFTAYNRIKTRD